MDDSPSGTFSTASISATRPQEWTVLTASRYFVICDFKCSGCLVFRIRETSNLDMSMGSQSCPRVPTDGRSDPISGFRNLRFPDDKVLCQLKTPVADIPMGRSISTTCPNCWTTRIKSRDFAWCKVKNTHLCESRCPDLRIGRSRDTRPSLYGRLRFPLAISELEMSRPSRPRELRYPERRYPDKPTPFGTFTLLFTKL
jgi:hypothetical protein